jgi:medium-chain acyl-[acyl-carrier-protein] hydrolase
MNRWFPYGAPNPTADVRLYCFPYAGGSASFFHSWWRRSNQAVDLVPVQLPGRENRIAEKPESSMRKIVDAVADALAGHLQRPFAFFGHSMGATLAYELTQRLLELKMTAPVMLFASGAPAPGLLDGTGETYQLPRDGLVDELRRLNGTPTRVLEDESLLELILPRLRADGRAADTYRYPGWPRLDIPVSVFGGTRDPDVLLGDLLRWQDHCNLPIRTRLLPGDHFFVAAHSATLCDLIFTDLRTTLSS